MDFISIGTKDSKIRSAHNQKHRNVQSKYVDVAVVRLAFWLWGTLGILSANRGGL
jgi:hypothetical protein